jgi:hypothetical protein
MHLECKDKMSRTKQGENDKNLIHSVRGCRKEKQPTSWGREEAIHNREQQSDLFMGFNCPIYVIE